MAKQRKANKAAQDEKLVEQLLEEEPFAMTSQPRTTPTPPPLKKLKIQPIEMSAEQRKNFGVNTNLGVPPPIKVLSGFGDRYVDWSVCTNNPLIPLVDDVSRTTVGKTKQWLYRTKINKHNTNEFAKTHLKEATSKTKDASLLKNCNEMLSIQQMLRDKAKSIQLDKTTHVYTLNGEPLTGSVTSTLTELCGTFNEEQVIEKMLGNRRQWMLNKLYTKCNFDEFGNELNKQQKIDKIREDWNTRRDKGTRLHDYIEQWYSEQPTSASERIQIDKIEQRAFLTWERFRIENNWMLIAKEYPIYDVKSKIAGTIDALYLPNAKYPNQVVLVDWKRCNVTTTVGNMFYEHPLLRGYAKGNYWKYAMQLNMYREILEQNYDLHAIDMFVVAFPPNTNQCELFGVPRMLQAKTFLQHLRDRVN